MHLVSAGHSQLVWASGFNVSMKQRHGQGNHDTNLWNILLVNELAPPAHGLKMGRPNSCRGRAALLEWPLHGHAAEGPPQHLSKFLLHKRAVSVLACPGWKGAGKTRQRSCFHGASYARGVEPATCATRVCHRCASRKLNASAPRA